MNSDRLKDLVGAKATTVGPNPLHKRGATLGVITAAIIAASSAYGFIGDHSPSSGQQGHQGKVFTLEHQGHEVDFNFTTMQRQMANGEVQTVQTLNISSAEQLEALHNLPGAVGDDFPLKAELNGFNQLVQNSLMEFNDGVDQGDPNMRNAGLANFNKPGDKVSYCFTFSHNQLDNPVVTQQTPDGLTVSSDLYADVASSTDLHFSNAQMEHNFAQRHEIGHCGMFAGDLLEKQVANTSDDYRVFVNEVAADIYALASLPDRNAYIESVVALRNDPNTHSSHATGAVLRTIQDQMNNINWPANGASDIELQKFTANMINSLDAQGAIPSFGYFTAALEKGESVVNSGRAPMMGEVASTTALLDFESNLDTFRKNHQDHGDDLNKNPMQVASNNPKPSGP